MFLAFTIHRFQAPAEIISARQQLHQLTGFRMKCFPVSVFTTALVLASSVSIVLGAGVIKPDYVLRSTTATVGGWWAAETPPALKIKDGQVVAIDTVNLAGLPDDNVEQFFIANGISLENQAVKDMIAIKKYAKDNPTLYAGTALNLTGPIFVEGAMPGDTLEVRILDIKSRTNYGVNGGRPGGGGIPDLVPRPYSKVFKLDLDRMVTKFSDTIEIPLRPFQGKVGVAPVKERGKLRSNPPYPDIGGNFDNKYFTTGATIYLPVHVPGALFQTGDPHAVQGNGEVSGSAIESCNTVTMQFIVRKDLHVKLVRAENATHYIIMGLDEDLSKAMHNAISNTVDFLKETKGLDFLDSLSICSIITDFEVTEVVDGTKTISGMVPKAIFKDGSTSNYWYK
jgi:acetamidase/formamidase